MSLPFYFFQMIFDFLAKLQERESDPTSPVQQKLAQIATEKAGLESANGKLAATNQNLEAATAKLTATNQNLVAANSMLAATNQNLEAANAKLQQERAALKQKLRDKEAEVVRLDPSAAATCGGEPRKEINGKITIRTDLVAHKELLPKDQEDSSFGGKMSGEANKLGSNEVAGTSKVATKESTMMKSKINRVSRTEEGRDSRIRNDTREESVEGVIALASRGREAVAVSRVRNDTALSAASKGRDVVTVGRVNDDAKAASKGRDAASVGRVSDDASAASKGRVAVAIDRVDDARAASKGRDAVTVGSVGDDAGAASKGRDAVTVGRVGDDARAASKGRDAVTVGRVDDARAASKGIDAASVSRVNDDAKAASKGRYVTVGSVGDDARAASKGRDAVSVGVADDVLANKVGTGQKEKENLEEDVIFLSSSKKRKLSPSKSPAR